MTDPNNTQLIVLSGTVVARTFAPGEAVSATDSFEFDSSAVFFNANQIINGDGSFKEFPVPAHNAVSPSSGTAITGSALSDLRSKYYLQPYNNNLEPRLNEIDVPLNKLSFRLFYKGAGSPWYLQDLSKVHVYGDKTMALLDEWDKTEYTLNAAKDILTLNDANTFFQTTAKDKDIVLFFEDQSGHLSGALDPVLRIRGNAVFTWNLLFGEWTPKTKKTAVCGDGIKEASEQCDDGNTFVYDKCDNSCKPTDIVVYTDFGGTTPSAVPDYADGSISANLSGTVTLLANGMKLDPLTDAYIGYTNSTWPDLQKGSMEFIVNGADLKSNPGKEFYLFDMQEFSNASDPNKRIKVFRKVTNILEFNITEQVGVDLIAKTTTPELTSLPSGSLKVQVIWDVNAANDPDKAVLKIYDGNTLLLTKNNIVPGTSPNLGTNTLTTYDFFVGSKVGGKDKAQFPGLMSFFMIKSK